MLNDFIEYLKEQLGQPYLWGGQHTKLTPENYISVIEKREKGDKKKVEAVVAYCDKKFAQGNDILYAYDCSGLGCYWLYNLQHLYKSDVNANTMMGRCIELDTPEPPMKGWWVFRLDGSRAVHIGYMIDDEYLIEAKGRAYGVVKTKWREDDWDCWGIPLVFADELMPSEDEDEDEPIYIPEDPEDDPIEEPDEPVAEKEFVVKVLKGSVYVRNSDSKKGKILFTAHAGNKFDLIDVAPTGWYHIKTYKGEAYISNREDLTAVVEK